MITELFADINLSSYFRYFSSKTTPVPEEKVWTVLLQMTDLMSYCQKKGIMHNDLRP